MRFLLSALAVVGVAVLAARMRAPGATAFELPDGWDPTQWGAETSGEQDQTSNAFEDVMANIDPRNLIPLNVPAEVVQERRRAFLDMLAWAEDTSGYGDRGYNVFFGHGLFHSYADHPRRLFPFTDKKGRQLKTSAAGRYQFIAPTWDALRSKLQLPDFGPASQDAAALELVREKGALRDVDAGRTAIAIDKVRKVWASLPGAGYAQGERTLNRLLSVYADAGGTFESQA